MNLENRKEHGWPIPLIYLLNILRFIPFYLLYIFVHAFIGLLITFDYLFKERMGKRRFINLKFEDNRKNEM